MGPLSWQCFSDSVRSITANAATPVLLSGFTKVARNPFRIISFMSEEFFKETSWEQKQQLEKLSGTGYRLSQRCIISINDSKEDIYLCENASDSYLRFGARPWNHSGENDKYTQTASAATSIPVFPQSPVYI